VYPSVICIGDLVATDIVPRHLSFRILFEYFEYFYQYGIKWALLPLSNKFQKYIRIYQMYRDIQQVLVHVQLIIDISFL